MIKKFIIIEDFISKEALSGIILFIATIAAVIVANSAWGAEYYNLWHMPLGITLGDKTISMSLTYWINDGLMALFFLMVGLEIKREMVIGELSSVSKASFPIVAALGGMVIPALIYVAFNPDNFIGFGIPMATDIAFALGILMLFHAPTSMPIIAFSKPAMTLRSPSTNWMGSSMRVVMKMEPSSNFPV